MDRKKLAAVHIVKKELQIPDDQYRQILMDVAGVKSSKDLDDAGFKRLMNYLVRNKRYYINKFGMTLKQKLYIKALLDNLAWTEDHFQNFLKKYYKKSSLTSLTRKEAIKLIESLKNIRGHQVKHN